MQLDKFTTVEQLAESMRTLLYKGMKTWTPTVTQSGAVTLTATYAKYSCIGSLVYLNAYIAITSAGTTNNIIYVGGLPITPVRDGVYGSFIVIDTGTGRYVGSASANTSNQVYFTVHNVGSSVGVAPNFALANGDIIQFTVIYPIV